jgi:hypothetical protein
MVVNPLNARIPNAVAPKKPPAAASDVIGVKSTEMVSATQIPTTPKIIIPPIFTKPINEATRR